MSKTEKQELYDRAVELGFAGSYESKTATELEQFIADAENTEPTAADEPTAATDEIEPNAEVPDEPADDVQAAEPPAADEPTAADEPPPVYKYDENDSAANFAVEFSATYPFAPFFEPVFVGRELRRLAKRFSPEILDTFRSLYHGLRSSKTPLPDGSPIDRPADVFLFLLGQIHAARQKTTPDNFKAINEMTADELEQFGQLVKPTETETK